MTHVTESLTVHDATLDEIQGAIKELRSGYVSRSELEQ